MMNSISFYIQGNSMAPTITNGDMVICRELNPTESIIENELYAVIMTTGEVLVKRVQKVRDRNSKIIQLKLISDNSPEQKPLRVSVRSIQSLLKVERKMTATA